MKYEEFPGEMTCIENSDIEVNIMYRSANAQDLWIKFFTQKIKLYTSLTHPVLQAIVDSLCFKYQIMSCFQLCLIVPNYAQLYYP